MVDLQPSAALAAAFAAVVTATATDTAISFLTLLTIVANLTTVAIVGVAVVGRFVPSVGRLWAEDVRPQVAEGGLAVAWLVAAVCMCGSLWFSEVAGFVPCRLCWFQRACMYPLVLVLAIAAVGRDARAASARALGLALATVGAGIAAYHVLIERFPSLESSTTCDPSNPCSLKWFEELGFITLPYMALSGFALILTLLVCSPPKETPL